MEISVSILNEKDNFKEVIDKINKSEASFIHLDILDNTYIKEKSFDITDFLNLKFDKKIDVHLMSSSVIKRVNEYKKLNPEYIIFHYEVGNTFNYINEIKKNNIKVGLAINPETTIDMIKEYLDDIDLLLVMGVNPGKGAQKYITSTSLKIKDIYKIKDKYNFKLAVDGGINDRTIKDIRKYVDFVVSGSYITSSSDYNLNISKLKKIDNN